MSKCARLILVAAIDEAGGVGRDGAIPWHSPADLQRFKALTMGGAVAYGRKTFESLPMPFSGARMLAGRYNILLSKLPQRDAPRFDPNGSIASSVREALEIVEDQGLGPLFVIGGTRAWREALELRVPALFYATRIMGDFGCDTFFPELDDVVLPTWSCIQDGPSDQGPVPSRFQIWSNCDGV